VDRGLRIEVSIGGYGDETVREINSVNKVSQLEKVSGGFMQNAPVPWARLSWASTTAAGLLGRWCLRAWLACAYAPGLRPPGQTECHARLGRARRSWAADRTPCPAWAGPGRWAKRGVAGLF